MDDLTHLSLFSGIGGLDLAAELAGFRTVGQCEWADYPRAVLEKHWPGLPRWRDIRTLTGDDFFAKTGLKTVTVLSGGFPCQPFSTAGKRRGKDDDRYLWPEMLRVIQEIRPAWVVGENVAGIVSMALDTALSDLESIGYTSQALVIPACAVDAPHRRDRCAILAYRMCVGSQTGIANQARWKERHTAESVDGGAVVADTDSDGRLRTGQEFEKRCDWGEKHSTIAEGCNVSYSDSAGQQGRQQHGTPCDRKAYEATRECCSFVSHTDWQMRKIGIQFGQSAGECGFANDGWWPAEPDVGRVAHGIPSRVDRLKCLGNAVVPQQFYPIFRAIADLEVSQWENTQSAGCGL